jgi:hypothetical protein
MNGKGFKGHRVLIVLLILALVAVSCGQRGGEGQATQAPAEQATEARQAQPTAVPEQATPLPPTELPAAQPAPTATSESAKAPAVKATEPPEAEATEAAPTEASEEATPQPSSEEPTAQAGSTPAAAPIASMKSYRIHTIWNEGSADGALKSQWDTEYVADPLAYHHKSEGDPPMEVIAIGETLWTRFADMPWRETQLAEEDLAGMANSMSQGQSPVKVEEQTPLEDDIQWLMGQPQLKIAEGSLTPAGEETVNGVACKRYAVDSTYTYNVEYQTPLKGSATVTELIQGDIWVADQGGWPPFVVRSQVLETTTTQVKDGPSSTDIQYIEGDVTDVNSPDIVIEPPQ